MSIQRIGFCGLSLFLFSGSALAQEFKVPRFYAWHHPPFTQGPNSWDWADSKFNRMIYVEATVSYRRPDNTLAYREVPPTDAAAATLNTIAAGMYPAPGNPQTVFPGGDGIPGRIVVILNPYGTDIPNHDYQTLPNSLEVACFQGAPIVNESNYRTRFFYPEDRLDGIPDSSFGFPLPTFAMRTATIMELAARIGTHSSRIRRRR